MATEWCNWTPRLLGVARGTLRRVFTKYPEFDGLMLTFDETPYRVFDTKKVQSALSMPDRFAKVMNTIDAVAARL